MENCNLFQTLRCLQIDIAKRGINICVVRIYAQAKLTKLSRKKELTANSKGILPCVDDANHFLPTYQHCLSRQSRLLLFLGICGVRLVTA